MTTETVAPVASGLAYVGRVLQILPVTNADRLERAEVDCGPAGGRWWGVVSKGGFKIDDLCRVYLQDAILLASPEVEFLRKYHFRIRQQKLRGAPSEVLIMPAPSTFYAHGEDITAFEGVIKYEKATPGLPGTARTRTFPNFIPRTDEPNFQREGRLIEAMRSVPVYITQKLDGSSMTVYRTAEKFGVCSRNQEIDADPDGNQDNEGLFWKVARKEGLERIPDGYAVQGELVGPTIQGNPLGLAIPRFFAFQVYELVERRYLDAEAFFAFCDAHSIEHVPVLGVNLIIDDWSPEALQSRADGKYWENGSPCEGIVIRPMVEMNVDGDRVSVKVLNLNYSEA